MADLTPVGDEVQMRRAVSFHREERFEIRVTIVGGELLRPQTQPAGDAVDVRVHGEGRDAE